MKTITIKIGKLGEIDIEASGFKDSSCLNSLAELEKLFGEASEVNFKPEARHIVKTTKKIKV